MDILYEPEEERMSSDAMSFSQALTPSDSDSARLFPWLDGFQNQLRLISLDLNRDDYYRLLKKFEGFVSVEATKLRLKPNRATKFSRIMKRLIGGLKLIAVSTDWDREWELRILPALGLILTHYINVVNGSSIKFRKSTEEVASDLYVFIKLILQGSDDVVLDSILCSNLIDDTAEENSVVYYILLKVIQEQNIYTRVQESLLKFLTILKLFQDCDGTENLVRQVLQRIKTLPIGFSEFLQRTLNMKLPTSDDLDLSVVLAKIKSNQVIKRSKERLTISPPRSRRTSEESDDSNDDANMTMNVDSTFYFEYQDQLVHFADLDSKAEKFMGGEEDVVGWDPTIQEVEIDYGKDVEEIDSNDDEGSVKSHGENQDFLDVLDVIKESDKENVEETDQGTRFMDYNELAMTTKYMEDLEDENAYSTKSEDASVVQINTKNGNLERINESHDFDLEGEDAYSTISISTNSEDASVVQINTNNGKNESQDSDLEIVYADPVGTHDEDDDDDEPLGRDEASSDSDADHFCSPGSSDSECEVHEDPISSKNIALAYSRRSTSIEAKVQSENLDIEENGEIEDMDVVQESPPKRSRTSVENAQNETTLPLLIVNEKMRNEKSPTKLQGPESPEKQILEAMKIPSPTEIKPQGGRGRRKPSTSVASEAPKPVRETRSTTRTGSAPPKPIIETRSKTRMGSAPPKTTVSQLKPKVTAARKRQSLAAPSTTTTTRALRTRARP